MTRDDGEGDVFVHQSDIYAEGFRSLREQEPVEFELEPIGDGRFKAVNVRLPPSPLDHDPEMRPRALFFAVTAHRPPSFAPLALTLCSARFPPLHRYRCLALAVPSFRGRCLEALTAGNAWPTRWAAAAVYTPRREVYHTGCRTG